MSASATDIYPALLDAHMVAELLGVSEKTVYKYVKQGIIPARAVLRIGTGLRFRKPVVDAWLRGSLEDTAADTG